jgi:predicted nucleic acid-binding protein
MLEAKNLGRSVRAKDAKIATTAINHDATLLTRDEKLFNFLQATDRKVKKYSTWVHITSFR